MCVKKKWDSMNITSQPVICQKGTLKQSVQKKLMVTFKCQATVIARSLSLCKNFNVGVAHYLKRINNKLGILVHHDKVQFARQGA